MKPKAKLVNIPDIKSAIGMKGPVGTVIASMAMRVMGFCEINSHYNKIAQYQGLDFTENMLEEFNVNCDVRMAEIGNIPTEGPFIIVSNHPFGGWDGIILFNIIASIRPDFKILTNFVLSHIKNLSEFFIPVNPMENLSSRKSLGGVRAAKEHVMNGGCLGLFPAGEVSTYYGKKYVHDKEWSNTIVKFIKGCNVPVVPVYFHGANSAIFHKMGAVHPLLRTMNLPRELLRRIGKTVAVRIGKPISVSEISEYKDISELNHYLRSRCYSLESMVDKKKKIMLQRLLIAEDLVPVALPKNNRLILSEIEMLDNDPESKLFELGNFSCYLSSFDRIPSLMYEVGRRREITFRDVGEGTGKAIDLDKYDSYYKHLILWDNQKKIVVGGYRLGIGDEIFAKYGIEGFYCNEFFNYSKEMSELLPHSMELGRSYVIPEYQKEALPLMLLIRGLMFSAFKYPQLRYFLGPVSISSWYPTYYQSLMVYFIRENFSTSKYAKWIRPNRPFVYNFNRVNPQDLLRKKMDSIEKFDRFLLRISDNEFRLPTLVKKYLKLGGTILDFNVDKDFNDSLDGLVIVDTHNVPEEEIKQLARGSSNPEEIMRFFSQGTGS